MIILKLNGVGLVDKWPSTNQDHHFVKKILKKYIYLYSLKNVSSLALMFWGRQCFEDIFTKVD